MRGLWGSWWVVVEPRDSRSRYGSYLTLWVQTGVGPVGEDYEGKVPGLTRLESLVWGRVLCPVKGVFLS